MVGRDGGVYMVSFPEWVRNNPGKLSEVSDSSGVSRQTLNNVCKGMLLASWTRAKAISRATGGEVSPLELVATPDEIRELWEGLK